MAGFGLFTIRSTRLGFCEDESAAYLAENGTRYLKNFLRSGFRLLYPLCLVAKIMARLASHLVVRDGPYLQ